MVKKDVDKKAEYNDLVKAVNAIQTIDISNLAKKTKNTMNYDYDKNITTQEFNKLTPESFTSKLAQTNWASKNDISNVVKKLDFDANLKQII